MREFRTNHDILTYKDEKHLQTLDELKNNVTKYMRDAEQNIASIRYM